MAAVVQRTQGVDLNAARAAAAENRDDVDAQTLVADLDMLGGHVEDAFVRLIDLVRRTSGAERDRARTHLLGLFARRRQRRPARPQGAPGTGVCAVLSSTSTTSAGEGIARISAATTSAERRKPGSASSRVAASATAGAEAWAGVSASAAPARTPPSAFLNWSAAWGRHSGAGPGERAEEGPGTRVRRDDRAVVEDEGLVDPSLDVHVRRLVAEGVGITRRTDRDQHPDRQPCQGAEQRRQVGRCRSAPSPR